MIQEWIEKARLWLHSKVTDEAQKAWVDWFLAFMGMELEAAMNERKDDTLSEFVWALLKWRWLRIGVFVAFIDIGSHLAFGTPLIPGL